MQSEEPARLTFAPRTLWFIYPRFDPLFASASHISLTIQLNTHGLNNDCSPALVVGALGSTALFFIDSRNQENSSSAKVLNNSV